MGSLDFLVVKTEREIWNQILVISDFGTVNSVSTFLNMYQKVTLSAEQSNSGKIVHKRSFQLNTSKICHKLTVFKQSDNSCPWRFLTRNAVQYILRTNKFENRTIEYQYSLVHMNSYPQKFRQTKSLATKRWCTRLSMEESSTKTIQCKSPK